MEFLNKGKNQRTKLEKAADRILSNPEEWKKQKRKKAKKKRRKKKLRKALKQTRNNLNLEILQLEQRFEDIMKC